MVFIGDEGRRHAGQSCGCEAQAHHKQDGYQTSASQPLTQQSFVAPLQDAHAIAHPSAQPANRTRQAPASRAEHPGTGHRRERESIDGGEQNRAADGQCDRLIKASDRPWNQQHRDEYRSQNKRCGQHRSRELGHGIFCGLLRGIATLDASGDVFTHHDRVIHHDPRGQHQAKQDQTVEIRATDPHQHQAADEGHRHRQAWNHGQPPTTEKQHQHQKHEHHGIAEGAKGSIEVGLHRVGHIHDQRQFDTRGETGLQTAQALLHGLTHSKSVGAIALIEAHGNRAFSLQVHRLAPVIALSQRHAAHIFEAQDAAVVQSAQNKVLKLGLAAEPTLRFNRQRDQLSFGSRCSTDAADRGQHVLFSQSSADIPHREVGLLQPFGVEPETEGQLSGAENPDIAHAGSAEQSVPECLVKPASEKGGDILIRRVTEAEDHQEIV